jgi:hypothetical protein
MARIGDYTSLQAALAQWLWRDGDTTLTSQTDAFVDLFETNFQRDQRLAKMQEVFSYTITPISVNGIRLPFGFLELIRVVVTPNGGAPVPLTYVTPDEAATIEASGANGGPLRHYTILANNLVLVPTRNVSVGSKVELACYVFNKLANVPNGQNWLIVEHPDVYLYGSLIQTAAFIDDDNQIARWKTAHDIAMVSIATADRRKRFSGSPLQMRPSMSFVTRSQRFKA